jgi:hypothetical protein
MTGKRVTTTSTMMPQCPAWQCEFAFTACQFNILRLGYTMPASVRNMLCDEKEV